MARILSFTTGPGDWQKLLADPKKHWRPGYSAHTLAHCWEASEGFPKRVEEVLGQSTDPLLANLCPLLAVPEFKVPLPGGNRASQNDIFVLARSSSGPVSIMVEGKVGESFGPTLRDWSPNASSGRRNASSSCYVCSDFKRPLAVIFDTSLFDTSLFTDQRRQSLQANSIVQWLLSFWFNPSAKTEQAGPTTKRSLIFLESRP
jgi:hypothetical protein